MPLRPDIHLATTSSRFRDLGRRYFDYWGDDSLHLLDDEHRDIRIAFCRILKDIPTDGAIAFCGTGPRIAENRDLDSTLVGGHLADFPEHIFADFSPEMLGGSFRSISDVSKTVAARSHLVIRDFSRDNLGAKFDAMMRSRIEGISSVNDMDAFIRSLRESVGITEILRQPLREDDGSIDPRLIAKPDNQHGLQFERILAEKRPIRLIVANLLVSGMFAVTEMEFRNKLAWLREKFPREMTEERMIEALTAWHELLLTLNEHVGKEFIEDSLHANDAIDGSTPTIFLSADDTVTYTGLQKYNRLRMPELQKGMPDGVTMRVIDGTGWDHSHESIPHKLSVAVAVVRATPK